MCHPTIRHRLLVVLLAILLTLSTASAQGALVSHWTLNETTGPSLDSVASNNGTVGAGITRGTAGQIGAAYTFSGAGAVTVPDALSLKPVSFTISAWIKTTDGGAFRGIVDKVQSGVGGYSLDVNSGTSRFLIYSGAYATVAGPVVNDGNWHMLTGTYDAGTSAMKFFVDGVLQGSSSTGLAHTTESLVFGGDGISSLLLTGAIDDVGFWNEAIPGGRILEIYNFGLNGRDLTAIAVPEPSTCGPLGLGLIGFVVNNRRRRQAADRTPRRALARV